MIDAPQKADGQWLYLIFHCQFKTPVAHHFDSNLVFNRNIPLAQSEPTSVTARSEMADHDHRRLATNQAGRSLIRADCAIADRERNAAKDGGCLEVEGRQVFRPSPL